MQGTKRAVRLGVALGTLALAGGEWCIAGCGGAVDMASSEDGSARGASNDAAAAPQDAARDATREDASADGSAGASEGEAGATGPACAHAWTWSNEPPPLLKAVWGSGPTDVWAAGDSMRHWDGASWSTSPLPAGATAPAALWGSGKDDVWAVGDGAEILHFTAGAWSIAQAPVGGSKLGGVWGSGPSDVWAVGWESGDGGSVPLVEHWDGKAWSPSSPPASDGGVAFEALWAVWGSAPDDVWAAGSELLHWNGVAWSVAPPTLADLWDGVVILSLWGSGPSDVWAVGYVNVNGDAIMSDPCILHWDGAAWTPMPTGVPVPAPSAEGFVSVWGSGPADVWVGVPGGFDGIPSGFFHWDGALWSGVLGGAGSAIWGSRSGDVWSVGVGAQHWDGKAWAAVAVDPASRLHGSWLGVWGSGPDDVWANGIDQELTQEGLAHWNGTAWTPAATPVGQQPMPPGAVAGGGLWGSGPNDVWATAPGPGQVSHWDGTRWTTSVLPAGDAGTIGVLCFGGTGPSDVWAGGIYGLFHWDGQAWSASNLAASSPDSQVTGIWANSPRDAWAVGPRLIAHWDGTAWSEITLMPGMNPHGVWASGPDDVWVSEVWEPDHGSRIAHWNGSSWSELPIGASTDEWFRVGGISGTGPADVWLAGQSWGLSSAIFHWDGATWSRVPIPPSQGGPADLEAVWARGPCDAWAVGSTGGILRFH